ncbi:clathrin light chain-like isoform X2 [Paramacrobiotus metropolitanus]|uniref:clathrin light chain-like isoform X2 n=1 Tax=Paramacrobiotus metropolitanus TaxID=2943436 RepID=UPI002446357D|nr:clathrin light chain-like isoform X2 [Paramacrobiotus metropolitanus]
MDPFGVEQEQRTDSAGEEEVDPAAAFIAQERNTLAGLEDDDFDKVNAFDDGFGMNGEHQNLDAHQPTMTNVREDNADPYVNGVNGDDFMDERENGFGNSSSQMNGPSVFEPPKIRPSTPEKIRKWREDQKERLEKKDADEEKKKQELREQARKELEEWYQLQDENSKKARKNNRDSEKDFVSQRDSDKPGEEWERVARMCDFNPKSAKGTKDVSRLRSIILQLKQGG